MEETYVVYSEEYYFSMNELTTNLRKNVYNVCYDLNSAEEIKNVIEDTLKLSVDSGEINSKNEMLTAYNINVVTLQGKYTIDEAKNIVMNDDYTWGQESHSR